MSTGSVIDKAAVRDVLLKLVEGGWFTEGAVGIEQATNRICALQRRPRSIQEVALTVDCPFCRRTPGNRCLNYRGGGLQDAHPSRINAALAQESFVTGEPAAPNEYQIGGLLDEDVEP